MHMRASLVCTALRAVQCVTLTLALCSLPCPQSIVAIVLCKGLLLPREPKTLKILCVRMGLSELCIKDRRDTSKQ